MINISEEELQTKFWDHVVQTNYCWLWNGSINTNGYGLLFIGLTQYYAHRFSALIHNGKIPYNKEIHHECRTRNCVNPGHFRFVTRAEHMKLFGSTAWVSKDNTLDIYLQYKQLLNEEQLIVTLDESMNSFGGLNSIKQMLSINRFYHNSLIIDVTEDEFCRRDPEQIIISPFKRKYFWNIKRLLNHFSLSLLEVEILLSKPFSNDLQRYFKNLNEELLLA